MGLFRVLKITLLAGVGALLVALVLSVGPAPRSEPASVAGTPPPPDTDAFVQQGTRVRIERTREGSPALRLAADSSRTRASGVMELEGVTLTLFGPSGRVTRIEAPHATNSPSRAAPAPAPPPGRPRDRKDGSTTPFSPSLQAGTGSWSLSGGVSLAGAGDMRVTLPSLNYDESTGLARSADPVSFKRGPAAGSCLGMEYDVASQTVRFLQDVNAGMAVGGLGQIQTKARSATYDDQKGLFQMNDYHSETSRGEALQGRVLTATFLEEGGITSLEGHEGFELSTIHSEPSVASASPLSRLLALEGKRTMRGQRLVIHLDEEQQPDIIEVSGQASVIAETDGKSAPSSLDAQTLTFDLTKGSLTRARASGEVALSRAPSGEGDGFRMKSEKLDASFDPNAGSLLSVSGEGHIQLWDQGIRSEGNQTFLDPNSDIVTLVGDGTVPARVTWSNRMIEARRIEVDRRKEILIARDGVRANYLPDAAAPAGAEPARPSGDALPFFHPGEMIHAVADRLTVSDEGRTARYEGHVRLWQGESRLEAGQVDVRESDGTLGAGGEVTTTFRQPPAAGAAGAGGNPSDAIVTVSSGTMSYRRRDDRVDYAGKVLVTQGPTRVTSEALAVYLQPGTSTAQRIEADGKVEVKDRGRVGHGDRLVVDLAKDTLKLVGTRREATVQDESNQQVVRGSALTMDRAGDRILVESEMGGRTWITLKPRQKGAPGVGTNPDH